MGLDRPIALPVLTVAMPRASLVELGFLLVCCLTAVGADHAADQITEDVVTT